MEENCKTLSKTSELISESSKTLIGRYFRGRGIGDQYAKVTGFHHDVWNAVIIEYVSIDVDSTDTGIEFENDMYLKPFIDIFPQEVEKEEVMKCIDKGTEVIKARIEKA